MIDSLKENKKIIFGVVALIVILAGVFFGARFTASYYYKKGVET